MPSLLTKRKAKWVAQRKPQGIRGAPLNNPTVLEVRYAQKLDKLVAQMTDHVEKEIRKLFDTEHAEEYFETAQDASVSSQARILTNALMKKINGMFAKWAQPIAEQQVNDIDKASSSSVHASLKEMSGGLSLPTTALTSDMKQVLKASVIENVSLIKSISVEYLGGVQQAVMRSITTGRGLADLVPYLQKSKEITQRRAVMIARDQTRKSYNALNKARMQKLGLSRYEWLHTGGSSHPRQLHINYSGKVFDFSDPPIIVPETGERGIPGQAINCRCRMRPVIEFQE